MPYFSQAPSSGLAASLRRAVGGSGGQIDPMQEIEIDAKAAQTAHNLAMVDKLRAEVKAKQDEQAYRSDPVRQAEFASHTARIDLPTGQRLMGNIRGEAEPWSAADQADADAAGATLRPYAMARPNVSSEVAGRFQDALAALSAERFGEGKSNAESLVKAVGEGQKNNVLARAAEAAARGDIAGVNLNSSGVLHGKELTPFKTNEAGITTNEWNGKRDETSPLFMSKLDELKAKIGQANAAAGASGAHAGLFNAQADKVRNPGTEAALGKPPQGYRWGDADESGAPTLVPIAGGPAEKLGEAQMKQIAGVQSTRNAIAEYRAAIQNWSKADMLNPGARARMGTIYNNMLLQAKEAYNLGVLNGPDYQILQEVVANPNNFKSGLISKESLDTQAAELDRLMKGIGITVDATGRQRTGGAPAAPAKADTTKVINGTTYVKVDGKWYQR